MPSIVWPQMDALEPRVLLDATVELFGGVPPVFIANAGQWGDPAMRYVFRGDGAVIGFTDRGPVFELSRRGLPDRVTTGEEAAYLVESTRFSVRFEGARDVTPVGAERAATRFNYFVGDASAWRADVGAYASVVYPNLYDGIDLHAWGRGDGLKYEFHVAAGADGSQIAISYDGVEGLTIDDAGALHVRTACGELIDAAPYIYQVIDGQDVPVAGAFELLDADTVTLAITGDYDPTVELIIDPELVWGAYFGGHKQEWGAGFGVDAAGNVLIGGTAESWQAWAGGGATDPNNANKGEYDAFVLKVTPAGELAWATYLGGTYHDYGRAIAVDAAGNAALAGETYSADFCGGADDGVTNNSPRGGVPAIGETFDAFVAVLDPEGCITWATYCGGADRDSAWAVTFDGEGNVLAAGKTMSADLGGGADNGTANNGYKGGKEDAFVARFTPAGDLAWATYLGGGVLGDTAGGSDNVLGITTDAGGNVLVTGGSTGITEFRGGSNDAVQTDVSGGNAFLAKLTPDGAMAWATFFTGLHGGAGAAVALNAAGDAFVTGSTRGSLQANNAIKGYSDAFVARFTASGTLAWLTHLGGERNEDGRAIVLDSHDAILVAGRTWSASFSGGSNDAVAVNSYKDLRGYYDGFVARLTPSGEMTWAFYIGGADLDEVNGIALDDGGDLILAGTTRSADFRGGFSDTAIDGRYNGFDDIFLVRLAPAGGDADRDGDVDLDDFVILKRNFGTAGAAWDRGDFDGDGTVGLDDFVILKRQFGAPSAAGAADLLLEAASDGPSRRRVRRRVRGEGAEPIFDLLAPTRLSAAPWRARR
ncbi:MAG: LEPR-XLL domain-containing protein [Planctomycetes bacterium]|nr:LEPR-XLL domain-containing protein [Planctomycetota bacterium]